MDVFSVLSNTSLYILVNTPVVYILSAMAPAKGPGHTSKNIMAVIIGKCSKYIYNSLNNKDIPFLGDVLYAVKYERIIAHNEPTIVANIAIKSFPLHLL